jgi:hypothetical protein
MKSSDKNLSHFQIIHTKNFTRTDKRSNPGLRGDRTATNHLDHGMATLKKESNVNYS